MRDDIIGMLRNAIDHGGDPLRVAQSLINSGYPPKDVKEAYEYVRSTTSQLNQQQPSQAKPKATQPTQVNPMQPRPMPQQMHQGSFQQRPIQPIAQPKSTIQQPVQTSMIKSSAELLPKQLPSQKTNPASTGKITVLVIILTLLIISLISLIVFKDTILDLF